MSEYEIGDIVFLRSGGPNMTVYLVTPMADSYDGPQLYEVCWFDDAELRRDSFSEPELEKAVTRDVT